MDEQKSIILEQLEIVKGYVDDKDGLNIKSAEFVDSTVKFYTSEDKSGEPVVELVLPEEMFLDGSKTEFVDNFEWSIAKYPKSTDPELNGQKVLVLAVKSVRTIRYSFISLESVLVKLTGGETDNASVTVEDDIISVDVKVSEQPDNRVVKRNDGLYVEAVDTTPTWTVSTDEEVSELFPLEDTPSYDKSTLGEKNVGDIVQIIENDIPTDFIIIHKGNPDSKIYDKSCEGVWLLRKDAYSSTCFSTSSNTNYALSDVDRILNGSYLNDIEEKIQKIIKEVKIPYDQSNGQVTNMSCQVFSLSSYEAGCTSYVTSKYSAKLDYFTSIEDDDITVKRICKNGVNPVIWWLRSVSSGAAKYADVIDKTGALSSLPINSYQSFTRPAFILPYETAINSDDLVVG